MAVPRLVLYPRVRHPPRAGGPTISCRSRRPAVKVTGPYQPPVCDHHIEQPNLSRLLDPPKGHKSHTGGAFLIEG